MDVEITIRIGIDAVPDSALKLAVLHAALQARTEDAVALAMCDSFEDGDSGKDFTVRVSSPQPRM